MKGSECQTRSWEWSPRAMESHERFGPRSDSSDVGSGCGEEKKLERLAWGEAGSPGKGQAYVLWRKTSSSWRLMGPAEERSTGCP